MSYTLTTLRSALQDYTENSETTFNDHLRDFIRSAENRIFKLVDFEDFRKNATSALSQNDEYIKTPTDFLAPFSLSLTSTNVKTFLLEKDVNFLQEYGPNAGTTGTPKYYGRFDVDNFIVAPTPDANYAIELHYYYKPTSLADSTILFTVPASASFEINETITGSTSSSTTTILTKANNTSMNVIVPLNAFTTGETITGSKTGATTTISSQTLDTTTSWLSTNAMNAMLYGSLIEAYTYMKGEADLMTLYEKRFQEEIMRLKDLGEARENSDAYRDGLPKRPRT
jgi:hypothetical protein